ncbi:MAG: sulfatase [Planctomycetota bacterium]
MPQEPGGSRLGQRLVPWGLILGGSGLMAAALLGNMVRHGKRGLGPLQLAGAALGFVALSIGIALEPRLRRQIAKACTHVLTPVECMILAAAIGLLNGAVELGHHLLRAQLLDRLVRQPPEVLWLAPVSYVVWHGIPAAFLALLAWVRPGSVTVPVALFTSIVIFAWSQLSFYGGFDPGAMLLLAMGIGVALGGAADRRGAALLRASRRTVLWAGAAVVLTVLAIPTWRVMSERSAQGEPAPASSPNVLLIVLDTVRADNLPTYGYPRATTPSIDRLARDGVVFDRAYATAPWTLPTHASLFTGRYHHETSVDWRQPLDGAHPTLAELLTAHGYATGGFVGNLRYCLAIQGLARGFGRYEDFQLEPAVALFASKLGSEAAHALGLRSYRQLVRNDAVTVTDLCLDWLDTVDDRPFFAFLNYFDAHESYLPPPELVETFGPRSPKLEHWQPRSWLFSKQELQGFIDAYDACILAIDLQIERLLQRLRETGRLDNTLIVVVGDHGEMFGEHEIMGHGNNLYRECLQVPLIFHQPGDAVPSGTRIDQVVSLRDVPATILALLDVDAAPLGGHSLRPLWLGAPDPTISPALAELTTGINPPPWEPHAQGPLKALIAEGAHYIRVGDANEQLYDLADTYQQNNLAESPAAGDRLTRIREALDALLAQGSGG